MAWNIVSSAQRSSEVDGRRARSRGRSALRLVILLVVTGVVAALVMAGAFVELTRHLNAVGH